MAGISSKALAFGEPENKKKYNGIEKENDLQIEVYDAQLRELDGQTGRWWQIDPKTDDYEMWSPYTSNYDNPLRYSDPLGDEGQECCQGLKDWLIDKADRFVTTWQTIGDKIADTWNQAGENFSNRQEARVLPWQQIQDNPLSLMAYVEMGPLGGLANAEGRLALSQVNATAKNELNLIRVETNIAKRQNNVVKSESNANVGAGNSGSIPKQKNAPAQTGIPNSSKIEAVDPTGRTTKYSTYGKDGNIKKQVQIDKGTSRHGVNGATKKVPVYNTNPSTGERFMNGYKIKKAMPAETPPGTLY